MVRLYHREIHQRKTRKSPTLLGFLDVRRGIRSSCVSLENSTCLVLTAIELETVTKKIKGQKEAAMGLETVCLGRIKGDFHILSYYRL